MDSLSNMELFDRAIDATEELKFELESKGEDNAALGAAEARRLLEFFKRFDSSADSLLVRVIGCLRTVVASDSVYPGETEFHRGARLAADRLSRLH